MSHPPKAKSGPLSAGEKAGVGLGAALGLLLILGLLAWALWERRKRARWNEASETLTSRYRDDPSSKENSSSRVTSEMNSAPLRSELGETST